MRQCAAAGLADHSGCSSWWRRANSRSWSTLPTPWPRRPLPTPTSRVDSPSAGSCWSRRHASVAAHVEDLAAAGCPASSRAPHNADRKTNLHAGSNHSGAARSWRDVLPAVDARAVPVVNGVRLRRRRSGIGDVDRPRIGSSDVTIQARWFASFGPLTASVHVEAFRCSDWVGDSRRWVVRPVSCSRRRTWSDGLRTTTLGAPPAVC